MGRSEIDSCPQCKTLETENYVLNNCSIAAAQGRYTWRHDVILRHLVSIICSHLGPTDKLYADLEGLTSPSDIFNNVRPDIVIVHDNISFVLELTCCYERNFGASKSYKVQKYSDIGTQNRLDMPTKLYTIEISSLGFVNDADLCKFCKSINIAPFASDTIRRLGELSLRCSYFIFCCRHKVWPNDMTDPIIY